MEKLFKERTFNETQRQIRCKVLINYDEIREITIGELLEFISEVREYKRLPYDIPSWFEDVPLDQGNREVATSNEDEFKYFLIYLYYTYRKIEIQMEKIGYPNILPDPDYSKNSFMNVCMILDKAKEEYKSMRRNDFLEMYPVLKKLFFSYMNYIRYSIEHMHNMDEGDYLPGTIEEIKCWLQELNTWSLTRNK